MRPTILLSAFLAAGTGVVAASQVPAGPPYESDVHPNPIVTFATDDDFVTVPYGKAREDAGIDLMGLSASLGVRESVGISPSFVDEVRILGDDTDVLFYPVVRQIFRLVEGERLVLYSFRDPSPIDIPADLLDAALDQHAFNTSDDPAKARFGDGPRPEQLEIRGAAALLFDQSETSGSLSLFWQDEHASHVATARITRERLFQIVRDLF